MATRLSASDDLQKMSPTSALHVNYEVFEGNLMRRTPSGTQQTNLADFELLITCLKSDSYQFRFSAKRKNVSKLRSINPLTVTICKTVLVTGGGGG